MRTANGTPPILRQSAGVCVSYEYEREDERPNGIVSSLRCTLAGLSKPTRRLRRLPEPCHAPGTYSHTSSTIFGGSAMQQSRCSLGD